MGSFIGYSKPLGGNFPVFTDLGMGYRIEELIYFTAGSILNTTTNKANGFYVGVTLALFLNINKGFGLNFNIGGLGYNALKNKTHNVVFAKVSITFK